MIVFHFLISLGFQQVQVLHSELGSDILIQDRGQIYNKGPRNLIDKNDSAVLNKLICLHFSLGQNFMVQI